MIVFSSRAYWDYGMVCFLQDSNWTMHHSHRVLSETLVASFVQLEIICALTDTSETIIIRTFSYFTVV